MENTKNPYEVGKKLLVPLLKKKGIHQLDYVILTHQDTDHSKGLQAVVEEIPVKRFIFNGTFKANADNEKLFSTILEKRIPLIEGMINVMHKIRGSIKPYYNKVF
ncbi:MBL fold metallo-hydrolase [Paenibacillus larvae]|nr:MBL fold metallo-hydrolase [Paenibacillus larvae]MDT2261903.1 MBL fold metallo-hydrolase [Paenibacillus larvae]